VKLLIATRNEGKLREFRRLLSGLNVEMAGLGGTGVTLQVEETGSTFRENACLKAAAYSEASGLLTLADDSGLEVDALGGAPGVQSARYGGPGLSDAQRVGLLLDVMKDVPGWERTARFRAVLALAGSEVPGGMVTVEGVVEGAIAHQSIGLNGFGYDPVFWIPRLANTTAAISAGQKDAVSHRGVAARRMAEVIRGLLASRV
jgi:XTP/dITP diphosphohydrolase